MSRQIWPKDWQALSLILIGCILGCNANQVEDRSVRPSDDGEGDLPYFINEEVAANEAKVINGGDIKIIFGTDTVNRPVRVRLKKQTLADVSDEDAVELGSKSEVVLIEIVDSTSGEFLSSDDLAETFRLEQKVSGVEDEDNLKLVVVTNPSSDEQQSSIIDDVEIASDASLRLVASNRVVSASLKVTHALVWVTEVSPNQVTKVAVKKSTEVSTGGSQTTAGGTSSAASSSALGLRLATANTNPCYITSQKKLKCWGAGESKVLVLNGSSSDNVGDAPDEINPNMASKNLGANFEPVEVKGSSAIQNYGASGYVCVRSSLGAVKCWGDNQNGALGSEANTSTSDPSAQEPIKLGTSRKATQLSLGAYFACALLDDQTVKCWGEGPSIGQGLSSGANIGDGMFEMGDSLASINLGSNVKIKKVVAGHSHACAISVEGLLKCWGQNLYGQCGADSVNQTVGDSMSEMGDALQPINFGNGRTVKDVALGAAHTCALLDNGEVKCWGAINREVESSGALGYEEIAPRTAASIPSLPAVNLGSGVSVQSIFARAHLSCAILRINSTGVNGLKCWGNDAESGALANAAIVNGSYNGNRLGSYAGTMGDNLAFINLGAGVSVHAVSLGANYACAILSDSRVKCWGLNEHGEIGVGNTQNVVGKTAASMGDNLTPLNLE